MNGTHVLISSLRVILSDETVASAARIEEVLAFHELLVRLAFIEKLLKLSFVLIEELLHPRFVFEMMAAAAEARKTETWDEADLAEVMLLVLASIELRCARFVIEDA